MTVIRTLDELMERLMNLKDEGADPAEALHRIGQDLGEEDREEFRKVLFDVIEEWEGVHDYENNDLYWMPVEVLATVAAAKGEHQLLDRLDEFATAEEAYDGYVAFCREEDRLPASFNYFTHMMKKSGQLPIMDDGVRKYVGAILAPGAPHTEEWKDKE